MSEFKQEIIILKLENLQSESNNRKEGGWRYVQTLAVKVDSGVDLIYSFMKDGKLDNLKIESVTDNDVVPSISDNFIEAFVWENEIHDLFNINFENIAIDFKGNFYNVAVDAPMTIISKEALDRKEKQAKIDAALKAKKAKEAKEAPKTIVDNKPLNTPEQTASNNPVTVTDKTDSKVNNINNQPEAKESDTNRQLEAKENNPNDKKEGEAE